MQSCIVWCQVRPYRTVPRVRARILYTQPRAPSSPLLPPASPRLRRPSIPPAAIGSPVLHPEFYWSMQSCILYARAPSSPLLPPASPRLRRPSIPPAAIGSPVLHPEFYWSMQSCILYGDTTYSKSKDQPGKVANPARGQLNMENGYFPVRVRA